MAPLAINRIELAEKSAVIIVVSHLAMLDAISVCDLCCKHTIAVPCPPDASIVRWRINNAERPLHGERMIGAFVKVVCLEDIDML